MADPKTVEEKAAEEKELKEKAEKEEAAKKAKAAAEEAEAKAATKDVEYTYENAEQGKVFTMSKAEHAKAPKDLAAFIYRSCEGCTLKTKKIDILGGHCSVNGKLKIVNQKCTARK